MGNPKAKQVICWLPHRITALVRETPLITDSEISTHSLYFLGRIRIISRTRNPGFVLPSLFLTIFPRNNIIFRSHLIVGKMNLGVRNDKSFTFSFTVSSCFRKGHLWNSLFISGFISFPWGNEQILAL